MSQRVCAKEGKEGQVSVTKLPKALGSEIKSFKPVAVVRRAVNFQAIVRLCFLF